MRSLLALVLVLAADAQVLPSTGLVAHFSSADLRVQRDGNGNVISSALSQWTALNTASFKATQASTTIQPNIVENLLYCHSGVKFAAGQYMSVPDDPALDPDAGGFAVYVVSRQDSYAVYGEAVTKGDNTYSWEISHAAAGGMSLNMVYYQSYALSANDYLPYTDKVRWGVWGMHIQANATTGKKTVVGTLNNDNTGWLAGNFGTNGATYSGSLASAAPMYIGTPFNTYAGTILDVLVYKKQMTDTERQQVMDYIDAKYFLTCPLINSTNAQNGDVSIGKVKCEGARYGDECQQQCSPGFFASYGSEDHQCNAGEWTNAPLVCEKQCLPLLAPLQYGTCQKEIFNYFNNFPADFFVNKWRSSPRIPRSERDKIWTINNPGTGGIIVADNTMMPCDRYRPTAIVMDNPDWTANLAQSATVKIFADIRFTSGYAGFIFRYLDDKNHYKLAIQGTATAAGKELVVISVVNGVMTKIFNASAVFSLGTFWPIQFNMQGSNFQFISPAINFNFTDSSNLQGSVGLLVDGVAAFDKLNIVTDCDAGGNCLMSEPGIKCTHSCASGYVMTQGTASRTCGWDGSSDYGTWSGTDAVCSIKPPVINTTVIQKVKENSQADVFVGSPVQAYAEAAKAVLTFSIVQEFPPSIYNDTRRNWFSINSCSGQISVNYVDVNQTLNFENLATRNFMVLLKVVPNGVDVSAAYANITIQVTDVNEVAAFPVKPQVTVSVAENSPVGTLITPAIAGVEQDTIIAYRNNRYSIEVDGSDGIFGINAATGQLLVNQSELNFEAQSQYALRVRVVDATDPTLTDSVNVKVQVLDANDPPTMPAAQYFDVWESDATAGATFREPIDMKDDDATDTHTYSIVGGGMDGATVLFGFGTTPDDNKLQWLVPRDPIYWAGQGTRPFVQDGKLCRAVYTVQVNVTDGGGLKATSLVSVYVLADTNSSTPTTLPTFGSFVIGTNGSIAQTSGGEPLHVYGTNFLTRYQANVSFSAVSGLNITAIYWARSCSVVSTTEIQCLTPAGVGSNLVVDVDLYDGGSPVATTPTAALVVSYALPMITDSYGGSNYHINTQYWVGTMETTGGDYIRLLGSNLGNDCSKTIINYGPTADYDMFTGTCVNATHNEMWFRSGPGMIPYYLYIKLQVGGQLYILSNNNQYMYTIGYKQPNITRMYDPYGVYPGLLFPTPALYPSASFYTYLYFEGTNFGPQTINGAQTTITMRYGPNTTCANYWDTVGCPFVMSNCYKLSHVLMYCQFGDSWGTNLTFVTSLSFGGYTMYSPPSHLTAVKGQGTISHMPPTISAPTGAGVRNADTAGGQLISIDGHNLGPLMLQQAKFPNDIQVRYGNKYGIPDTPSTWTQRYQYQAQDCKIMVQGQTNTMSRLECFSAEGTGVGHDLRIRIGGQFSNVIGINTSHPINYGPPLVSSFDGPGAADALTSGYQYLNVNGKNFGKDMSVVKVDYTLQMDLTSRTAIPAGIFQDAARGAPNMTWTPANCTIALNHTQLQCYTVESGGADIKWRVTVDGQRSRDPYTYFGLPVITNVTLYNAAGAVVSAADPNGGTFFIAEGRNFGRYTWLLPDPINYQYVQWMSYYPGGVATYLRIWILAPTVDIAPQTITSNDYYFVASHTKIVGRLGPGYGTNLRFTLSVLDQISTGGATWSYATPTITRISPLNGTTKSTSDDPLLVKIFGMHFPGPLDKASVAQLTFGNAGDSSATANGLITCARNGFVGVVTCPTGTDCEQSVTCTLPGFNGLHRGFALRFTKPGIIGSTTLNAVFDPSIAARPPVFDFFDPQISYTSQTTVGNFNDAVALKQAGISFPGSANNTRVITLHGSNFGTFPTNVPGFTSNDAILRDVMVRPVGGSNTSWVAIGAISALNPPSKSVKIANLYWQHEKITFLTNLTSAEVMVRITARDHPSYSTGSVIQYSNIVDISGSKPSIQDVMPKTGFVTSGGEKLKVIAPFAAFSTGALMSIEVGEEGPFQEECKILNRNYADAGVGDSGIASTYVTEDLSINFLIKTCTDYIGAGNIKPESVCTFFCEMPPSIGGTSVPVFMKKDGKLSDTIVPIDYVAPVITGIKVHDTFPGAPAPITTYNPIVNPDARVVAPTDGAWLEITGTNLGLCGTLYVGGANKVDTCSMLVNVSHTRMWLPVPRGQGTGYNNSQTGLFTPFTIYVKAGNQASVQPSGWPIAFAYAKPEFSSVSPSTGPTQGGTHITITGRNFGQANQGESDIPPVVLLADVDGVYAPQECANVSRVDHYTIVCDVAEGSGAGLAIVVYAGNQAGYSASGARTARVGPTFSFFRPVITSVAVDLWPLDVYTNWPDNWNVNKSSYFPSITTFDVSNRMVGHGPTAGRYYVKITGSNLGRREPKGNCIHMMFDYSAIDCDLSANDYLCKCLYTMSHASAMAEPRCARSMAEYINTTTGYAYPICDGIENYPGEGEVWDDGGEDATDLSKRHVDGDVDASIGDSTHIIGSGMIISWTHDTIELLLPPGAGSNVLTVNARGQMPFMYDELVWKYDAPQVTEVRYLSGDMMTGPGANDVIELVGTNLGFGNPIQRTRIDQLPTREWVEGLADSDLKYYYNYLDSPRVYGSAKVQALVDTPSRPEVYRDMQHRVRTLPIQDGNAASAFHTTISWWKFCMSNALPYAPSEPAGMEDQWFEMQGASIYTGAGFVKDTLNCKSKPWPAVSGFNSSAYTILKQYHSSIVVRAHPGVGVNRTGAVHIHSNKLDMAIGNFTFSYSTPYPTLVRPNLLSFPAQSLISINGYNFGNPADAGVYWDPQDKVTITVDGNTFDVASSTLSSTADPSLIPQMAEIDARLSNVTVGHKDIIITTAGEPGLLSKDAKSGLYIVCSPGSYGHVNELCLSCPGIASCDGYQSDIEKALLRAGANMTLPENYNAAHLYPRPLPTYYNMNSSDMYTSNMGDACPDSIRAMNEDPSRDVCLVGCLPPEACIGGNMCREGYRSAPPLFACGTCDSGFYRRSMECIKCPDSPWMLVIGFIMLAVGAAGCGFLLNKMNVNIAFLSIAVDYFQVVSMFANSRIAWPAEIKALLHILSAFNLNIEIIAPECIKPDISYTQKWAGVMMLPISAMIVFVCSFAFTYVWKRYVLGQRGRAFLTNHRNSLIAMFLILFYFMYLYITRQLLEVFNCIPRNPDDGLRYMASVMEVCGKPGGTQLTLLPFAIAGLVIYTAGYPIFAYFTLRKYQFYIMLDQLLRAKGTGDTQMTNPQALHIRQRYSRIYYQYRPDTYWWMLVVVMRKFLIAFTALMFRSDGGFQMAVALLVLFAAYALQVKWEPFMSPSDRSRVIADHDRAKFEGGIHASLAEALKEAAALGRKKTTRIDWQAPKALLGKQILAQAGLFIFNYNTVEAVMLGCAILVCLSGIMFDSLALKRVSESPGLATADRVCMAGYTKYCGGLMYAVILLIAFSIFYLMVVITVEIYGAVREAQMAKASNAKRARMAKKMGLDGSRRGSKAGGLTGALERRLSKSLKDTEAINSGNAAADEAAFVAKMGVVETAVNPLFASQKNLLSEDGGNTPGSPGMAGEGFLNAAAIADMVQPPNPALWQVVRETYRTLLEQTQAQSTTITDLKRQVQQLEIVASTTGVGSNQAANVARNMMNMMDGDDLEGSGGGVVANPFFTARQNGGAQQTPREQLNNYRRPGNVGVSSRKGFAPTTLE